MFKLTEDERQFTARLIAKIPTDGNGTREESFRARYRILSTERMNEFDLTSKEGTDDMLRAVIVELFDLVGDDNQPTPYSEELREAAMNNPLTRRPLISGYFDNINKGRKGN